MRFERLLIISVSKKMKRHVVCLCDCGNIKEIALYNLKSGDIRSCKCLSQENLLKRNFKHGAAKDGRTREYRIWKGMKARCLIKSSPSFPLYGGRGISVCGRWLNNFSAFLEDMGAAPSPGHSLDRINNSSGYEPGNCRWATRLEQARNTRRTVYIEIGGVEKPFVAWCEEMGINYERARKQFSRGNTVDYILENSVKIGSGRRR